MHRGIFISLKDKLRFKGSKRQGQIATLIVLFIAVFALLIAVIFNITKVANKRMSVAEASIGATIQLASSLGSYAHLLSCKYLHCKAKRCKFNFSTIIMIIVIVLLIIATIVTYGATTPFLVAVFYAAGTAAFLGGITLALKLAVYEPRMVKALNSSFSKMDPGMRFREEAILSALRRVVDDPAQVVDLHDFNYNGIYGFDDAGQPKELIDRFIFKYTQRAMWLVDDGPAPDGSKRGYAKKLKGIIADFIPKLSKFNKAAQKVSKYIGKAPLQPPGPKDDEQSPQPDPPAPAFSQPEKIKSLYQLFAYLEEREYPHTKNELYHLSYHIDSAGGRINIWTRDFVPCYEVQSSGADIEVEEDDPNNPCLHSPKNDELDSFRYDLYNFSDPEEGSNKKPDDFAGFAPVLLDEKSEERAQVFLLYWYPEIYSECDFEDEEEPEIIKDCKNPDYTDLYDRIWQVPDRPITEYLTDKGWDQALGDWLARLNKMQADIIERKRKLSCSQIDEPCKMEKERLGKLENKVEEAIKNLSEFKEKIPELRSAIEELHDKINALEYVFTISAGANMQYEEDALLYDPLSPTYAWRDSLGKHSVKVEVSKFKIPRLKSYKSGCCEFCVKLKNKTGKVWVRVTRTDEPGEAKFPTQKTIWKFTTPPVSYISRASWGWKKAPPKFLGIQKVK